MAVSKKVTTKSAVKTAETAAKAVAPKAEEKKAVEAAAAVEKKAEAVVKAAAPEKAEEKKAVAVKAETPKKTTAKKAETKKTPGRRAAKKDIKVDVCLQLSGEEYTQERLLKIAKDVWKHDLKQKATELTSVELYVKPEEHKAYYVMNKDVTGDFYI